MIIIIIIKTRIIRMHTYVNNNNNDDCYDKY